jgi:uncharacterized protein
MPAALASTGVASPPVERTWRERTTLAFAGLAFAGTAIAALAWAKWLPYSGKLTHVWSTGTWTGKDILARAGAAGSAPSLAGAWRFTWAYAGAIWKALVAALVIAAAMDALLARRWLPAAARSSDGFRGSLVGGVASLPSLMCTCCTAPIAVTLRRAGASRSTVLAYWVGNPVLNPAVLVFLALVAPWQWAATRIIVGCLLVFLACPLIARLAGGPPQPAHGEHVPEFEPVGAAARFAKTPLRLTLTLLPEYLLVVFLVGLLRGWLLPLGSGVASLGPLALLIAVLLGTLIVIPTGGEIPIVLGLAAAGMGSLVVGALLITLPAISAVSMAMVMRALSARTTLAMAGAVAACGAFAGALLWVLSG